MIRTVLEERVKKFFYNLGYFIASYPWQILFVCAVVFGGCSAGFYRFEERNNIRDDFTALDSESRFEYSVLQEFFQEKGRPFYFYIGIQGRNGDNLLEEEMLKKVLDLENYLQKELTVWHNGQNATFNDLCATHCESNTPLRVFLVAWKNAKGTPQFTLEHPTSEIFGEEINVGNHLFQLDKIGNSIQSVKLMVLHFRATFNNETTRSLLNSWEHKVFDEFYKKNREPALDIAVNSEGLASMEVKRSGMAAFPYMSLTIVVILLFTITTSLKFDPVTSKPIEAAAGVLCPILALGTAFGLLMWLGVDYQPMVSVSQFLILAVGIDDAFLMLHAWHRTDKQLPVEQRLAVALSEAGPSITITSLTNALSFGIGASSPTPALRTFCIYTCVAILVEYCFQIFYFSAVMALGGRREAAGKSAYGPFCTGEKQKIGHVELQQKLSSLASAFLDKWSSFSISWLARGIVLSLLVIYWSISAYGFTQTNVQLSAEKLLLHDSPLQKWLALQDTILFSERNTLYVFVNNPGNLIDVKQLQRVQKLTKEFESLPNSLGAESTAFWLDDFMEFSLFLLGQRSYVTYELLPQFLLSNAYSSWSHFLPLNETACSENHPNCLKKFFFTTDFANATEWRYRYELLTMYRNLALNYSDLNVTVYEENGMFADQIPSISHVTKVNLLIAICCMMLVCAFFIPNILSIISATLSVLSINVGVFGFLMLWKVDLDPISMTTILMSVGFSVDFTAHVSYHYFKATQSDSRKRLNHTLSSVAWPTVQAGVSTFLAVVVLCLVDVYMVIVFVKTIFLVISLGLIHGLFVLPVVLSWVPRRNKQMVAIAKEIK